MPLLKSNSFGQHRMYDAICDGWEAKDETYDCRSLWTVASRAECSEDGHRKRGIPAACGAFHKAVRLNAGAGYALDHYHSRAR